MMNTRQKICVWITGSVLLGYVIAFWFGNPPYYDFVIAVTSGLFFGTMIDWERKSKSN